MRALLLLMLMGCSPLDGVMDDCGEPVRVSAPRDSLVIFHFDDGTPMAELEVKDSFVELEAPSCHGMVTVIDGAEARTLTDVAPGEWLYFFGDGKLRTPTRVVISVAAPAPSVSFLGAGCEIGPGGFGYCDSPSPVVLAIASDGLAYLGHAIVPLTTSPNGELVGTVEQWSTDVAIMRVSIANTNSTYVHTQLDYVLGNEPVNVSLTGVPVEVKNLARGVPIRVTTRVAHDNGVVDELVDELPSVLPQMLVDVTRAPHIDEVGWTKGANRAFTYRLSAHADAVAGCELWEELHWCVFAEQPKCGLDGTLVMPVLPPGLEPWSPPVIGFHAIKKDADRVTATSSHSSNSSKGPIAARLPFRTTVP